MTNRNTVGYDAKPKNRGYLDGAKFRKVDASWTKPASWIDADVVVLARNLSLGEIITNITQLIGSDLAGMIDVDFGFRRSDNEVVIDADILADGVSFATASFRDILGSGLTFDRTKTIGELLGLTLDQQPRDGVDLIMTINTAGVALGSVPMHIDLNSEA